MIPLNIRKEMSEDPYYSVCSRKNNDCEGRTTWEHSFMYAGKQIQEKWAIIPLCWYHHLGKGLNKEINHYIALCRADISDLCLRMPKKNWKQEFKFLKEKYGRKENKIQDMPQM